MANVIKHKRGSGSDPVASDLVVGEVAIRTDVGKLFTKMDNGTVAEIAGGGSDIAINTLSSSSGTGGGSATFNGSAYRFTLSAPPSVSAQQLLVSINGVIQKPVAGTGQPSEGFSVDGTDIILGDAPATGSDFFILTFKSLGVSEPADNSVTSAKIVDGAIVNADINTSAAIAGSKISPTFTSNLTIQNSEPILNFTDTTSGSSGDPDYRLHVNGGSFSIQDATNSNANRFVINNVGNVTVPGSFDVLGNIATTGNVTISNGNALIGTTTSNGFRFKVSDGGGYEFAFAPNDSGVNSLVNYDRSGNAYVPFMVSGSDLRFASGGNTERMRLDSSGRLGIGTTSPSSKIDIHCGTDNTGLQITSTDAGAFASYFDNTGASSIGHSGTDLVLSCDPAGSVGSSNIVFQVDSNNERMRLDSSGNLVVGGTSAQASDSATLMADGEVTAAGFYFSNNIGSPMNSDGIRRHTTNTMVFDTNSAERMRIDSTGDIGLGTTSPNLSSFASPVTSIGKSANPYSVLELQGNNTSDGAFAVIAGYNSGGSTRGAQIVMNRDRSNASGAISFETSNGGSLVERFRITRYGGLVTSQSNQAIIGRDWTSGSLAAGATVNWNGAGGANTNSKLNFNSIGGNGGGHITCLSVSSFDQNPSGALIVAGVHGQGFNSYDTIISNFDSGISVTFNGTVTIQNTSSELLYYAVNVIHMGTGNASYFGR